MSGLVIFNISMLKMIKSSCLPLKAQIHTFITKKRWAILGNNNELSKI